MADLITLDDVKKYSGISSTNQDIQINYLIPKVSNLIKNYCGRTFIDFFTEEKVEVFSGNNRFSLFLQEVPINEISSVEVSSNYGKTYTKLVQYVDYAHNLEDDSIDATGTVPFVNMLNGYRITYTGGYDSTPEDLKLAAVDLINYYMHSDMAVKSTRSPGSSATQVEYVMNATLPSHIRRVLDLYRLVL